MKCQRCGGTSKLYNVQAKCSDRFISQHVGGKEHMGYVPDWIGGYGKGDDAGGDYVCFTICRGCGQMQGQWPELDATMNVFKYGKAT